ncbi:MAG: SgcJ/EcaC family oxidoreductase [Luteolibacter sp.]
MNPNRTLRACLVVALFASPGLRAEETPDPAIAGLQKTAADFVAAYNKKDAAALAALFTPDGEICDLNAEDLTTGRDQIKAHYEDIFDDDDVPTMAVEVKSVRLVAPTLAIEDGIVHRTPPGENEPPRSTAYTAVLMKGSDGAWQIASSRSLKDVTDAAGQLADLADVLKGDWTAMKDGVRLDLAYGWDSSGKFLTGEMLTTTADAKPQPGTMRIGWDAAKKTIVSWIFDSNGGVSQGTWTPTDDGWLVRSEGTTGDGETMTANQELTTDGKDTLIWSVTNKVIDGEKQPDAQLRIVRQAPDAASN